MVLRVTTDASGKKFLVRPTYRPEDYATPDSAIRELKKWFDYGLSEVLTLPEANFQSYLIVDRYERDGKQWVLLYHAVNEHEYCLEVEDSGRALRWLEVRAVPPERAYEIARSFDREHTYPVIDEGEP